jgi:hypothetical protein
MNLSGLFLTNFKSDKQNQQLRMDLFVGAFENNYSLILGFLPFSEQHRLKLSKSASIQPAGESTT